ncbi:MAG: hypothetical protein JOZ81_16540 [Chloroflexi bacterium]|nr:hypothetical protein [Chloroflexota bacterium]MBV9542794.1 hypothetical protein [Chloroflexota bacterium]
MPVRVRGLVPGQLARGFQKIPLESGQLLVVLARPVQRLGESDAAIE